MPGCEAYTIIWESDTFNGLVHFFMQTAKKIFHAENPMEEY